MSLSYVPYSGQFNAQGPAGGDYGISLALDANSLVVASSGGAIAQSPILTIYPHTAGGATPGFTSANYKVVFPNLPPGSGYGNSLCLSDSDLAVGCTGDLDYTGAVYTYSFNHQLGRFEPKQVINNHVGAVEATGSEFADSVFVDSDSHTLIISAPNWHQMDGQVVVYSQTTAGVWDTATPYTLTAPGPPGGQSYFGSPIAATALLLAVSAVRYPQSGGTFGAAFIYTRSDYSAQFSYLKSLSAADSPADASVYSFGNSLAISQTTLLVGSGQAGCIFVYSYSVMDHSCTFVQTLRAPDSSRADYFGYSLAMTSSVASMGYMQKNPVAGTQVAGVYVYARTATGSFSLQAIIAPPNGAPANSAQYFGSVVAMGQDATLAVSSVGNHFTQGTISLYSPRCSSGSYLDFQQPGGCVLCAVGKYDSAAGSGSAAACMGCPTGKTSLAGSQSCSMQSRPSAQPSFRPTINTGPRASTKPTTSTGTPTSPSPTVPSSPTGGPFKIHVFSVPPTLGPTPYPTRATRMPSFRPSKPAIASKVSIPEGTATADNGASHTVSIIAGSLAAVVAVLTMACFFYRRFYSHRDAIPKAKQEGEDAETGPKKRLTAFEKWVVYEDHVRAKRIQSIFQQDTSMLPGGGIVIDDLSPARQQFPGPNPNPNRQQFPGSGISVELASVLKTSRESRGSTGGERLSVVLGNMPSPAASPLSAKRKSFNQLETLFQPPASPDAAGSRGSMESGSGGRASFRFSFSLGRTPPEPDPTSLRTDDELRASLHRLSEKTLPPITLDDVTQAIRLSHSTEAESEGRGSWSTLQTINPLMNPSSLVPQQLLRLSHAGRGGESQNRRLSVAGATKVANPLFSQQVRRQSLNNRLGRSSATPGEEANL